MRDCAVVRADADESFAALDWKQTSAPKLWRYNLHYFDWLKQPGLPNETGMAQMRDWIARNPPVDGDGWEPYPVSLRLVNWIRFLGQRLGDAPPPEDLIASIATQASWLARNLEYHLQANHLFENARALVFAGAALGGSIGRRIATLGGRLLQRELAEQFLADGGHYERSPMYHAILTEGLLDLVTLFQNNPALVPNTFPVGLRDALVARARGALDALAALTMPDGEIALFNDASFGIATPATRLLEHGARVLSHQPPSWQTWRAMQLPDTGYYAMGDATGRLLVDCGEIGPEYQPGHAHCDTLSYELAFAGRRVVVDPGNHDYEPGAERAYARSTAAHNTVVVDDLDQSELWGVFRVARRARPLYARLQSEGDKFQFAGAHDGYRRIGSGVVHHRSLTFDGRELAVADSIEGSGVHGARSHVHFAPGLSVHERSGELHVSDSEGAAKAVMRVDAGVAWELLETDRYPEFGRKERGITVCMRSRGALPLRIAYQIENVAVR